MEIKLKEKWDYLGHKKYTHGPVSQSDWNNTLLTKINLISTHIHMKTHMGRGNILKTNKKIFGLLKTLEYFKYNDFLGCYMVGHYKIVLDDSLDDAVYVIYETEHTKKLKEKNIIECLRFFPKENEVNQITFSLYIKDSEEHKKALENEENVFLTDDCYMGKVDVLNYNPDELEQHPNLKPLINEVTGEINLKFNKLPIEQDFFIPSPNYDESVEIDTLPGANLSNVDDLKYFFDAFLKTVERDKPDARAAKNLKIMIDCAVLRHNILDNSFKQKFVIPVGKLDEGETKSFITKLKEKIFKK